MSFTTASNYYNRVDTKFPVKGQDNDSQGFRDNWINIVRALSDIDDRADNLEKNAVLVENTTTNFLGNTLEDLNLRNYSTELYDNSELYGRIEIDYTLANYQKIEVPQGDHQVNIINWPGSGKIGTLTLEITPTGDGTLNFIDGISLGPELNPFAVSNDGTYIFELWHEGGAENYFVKNNNALAYTTATTATYAIFSTLYIGDLNRADQRNQFTVNTGTNTNLATVVTRTTSTTRKANLALVPNRITVTPSGYDLSGLPTTFKYTFASGTIGEVLPGAKFNVSGTNVIYNVDSVTSTEIFVTPTTDSDELRYVVINGKSITFTNPTFDLQDTVVTLRKTQATTSTGTLTNYIGSIYADKNRLEVTFDNYGNNTTNTFVATTISTSTDVYNTSTDLVSASFLHNLLPYGSIIMWYGTADNVPYGWALCDGTNGTPNLSNKFVIGANGSTPVDVSNPNPLPASDILGSVLHTGGYADAIIPEHSHDATATFTGSPLEDHTHEAIVNDPGHLHKFQQFEVIPNGERDNNAQAGLDKIEANTELAYSGITVDIDPPLESPIPEGTVSVTVAQPAGAVDTTGRNIPPFVALFYIMKVSGTNNTGIT